MKPGDFTADLGRLGGEPRLMVRYPNWVGDACMALPALDAIRRSLPGAKVFVLAKPWVADVVEMSGLADVVIRYEAPGEHSGLFGRLTLIRQLRRRRFQGAILLQNAFEAALIAAAAGVRLRGGYASDGRGFLLTHAVPPTPENWPLDHQVGYYLDLVRALGCSAPVSELPLLKVPGAVRPPEGTIALAPGASFGEAKMWPADRYVELGRRLASRGFGIAVLGSQSEASVCRRVAEGVGGAAEDLSGKTTLREAAAVLAGSAALVCNDSGLMHLAAALGTPVIGLFGSTDPEATGPVSMVSLTLRGEAPCAPCFRRRCTLRGRQMICFDSVTVDRVEASCLEILERSQAT